MSAETRALTEAHRQAQLAIRARTMRDTMSIMRLWTPGDRRAGDEMINSLATLTLDRHTQSAGVGLQYLTRYRTAIDVPRGAMIIPKLAKAEILPSLYTTIFSFVGSNLARGFSPQAARQNAIVTGSGSTGRLALQGGREAVTKSTIKDGGGWARITSPGACEFCLMLEDRGAVYSEDSVDFEAHDHCACTAEPNYDN